MAKEGAREGREEGVGVLVRREKAPGSQPCDADTITVSGDARHQLEPCFKFLRALVHFCSRWQTVPRETKNGVLCV